MLMLDLCCGLGGASAAFRDNGWEVVTVDNEPLVHPDIVADVRAFTWCGSKPDLIWASPPCTEFARIDNRPWLDYSEPDLSVYLACKRIISEVRPRFWVIENVRGAIPYFGQPVYSRPPFFLWGYFPALGKVRIDHKKEYINGSVSENPGMSYKLSRALKRAKVPYSLSAALCFAVQAQLVLF